MSTTMNHTIPIPLPENPEASGTLTRLLQAMEANGLCVVKQAVIVETESWNTYRLIEEVLTPPEPILAEEEEKNGQKNKATHANENVYKDPDTNETYSKSKMAAMLRFRNVAIGKYFRHQGEGLMVVFETDEGKLALRKVTELEA